MFLPINLCSIVIYKINMKQSCMLLNVCLTNDQQCIGVLALLFLAIICKSLMLPVLLIFQENPRLPPDNSLETHQILVLTNILLKQSLLNTIQRFPIIVATIYFELLFVCWHRRVF